MTAASVALDAPGQAAPVLSFCVAFLPAFVFSARRYPPLSAALAAWYLAAAVLSRYPLFQEVGAWHYDRDVPAFLVLATVPTVPLVVFAVWYARSERLRRFLLEEVPAWAYIGVQVYRLAGVSYLKVRYDGVFPDYFGLQVGLLDGFIGATALPLALYVRAGGLDCCRALVMAWSVVGMYDLAGAFSITIANFCGLLPMTIAPSAMGTFPMTLIIYFQVPLAIIIHGLFLYNVDAIIAGSRKKSE